MGFWNKKRGIVHLDIVGSGLLNQGEQISRWYDVTIVDETEDMYKVKFHDYAPQISEGINKWYPKERIKLTN